MRVALYFTSLTWFLFLVSCSQEPEKLKETIPQTVIGGYEPMLNVLNKSIEDDPDKADLYLKRAEVYSALFYYPLALKDAKMAVTLEEQNAAGYMLLAKIHYNLKNYIEAIKAAEKCQSLNSNDAELPIVLGKIYFKLDDTVRTAKAMEKAEQLVPMHSELYLLKSSLAAQKGDSSNMMLLLRKSIETNPRNLEALKQLLMVYNRRSSDDSLMYYLMDVRNLADRDAEIWFLEGSFYQRKMMKEAAMRCFQNSVRLDSVYAPSYLRMAQLMQKSGDLSAARKNYETYARLSDDDKMVYKQLIEIVTKTESEQAAIPFYEKLSQLDTTNVSLKYTLARLYRMYNVNPNPVPVAPSGSNSNVQSVQVPAPTVVPAPAPKSTPSPTDTARQ
ncbi:MAG: hypothetical protein MUF42_11950 [Cytophagaceae bacterium]|jgi:tetratricopeptide (TPR) repeat protein|nr:hypothetical protein [Cytophagaceae bacterium]